MGETKKDQITFRLEPDAFAATGRGAEVEDLKVADFARKLHRLALMVYERKGSLRAMREFVESIPASPGKTTRKGATSHGGNA